MRGKLTSAQLWLVGYLRDYHRRQGWPTEWIVTEHRFHEGRKWRFDVAIPQTRLAFECDGGKWRGGHRRGKALEADYERQNTAIMEGWRLLRFTNEQILGGEAHQFLDKWLEPPAKLSNGHQGERR